jgi:hypothetical protein
MLRISLGQSRVLPAVLAIVLSSSADSAEALKLPVGPVLVVWLEMEAIAPVTVTFEGPR